MTADRNEQCGSSCWYVVGGRHVELAVSDRLQRVQPSLPFHGSLNRWFIAWERRRAWQTDRRTDRGQDGQRRYSESDRNTLMTSLWCVTN